MQPLAIPNGYMWSRRQPERGLNFNSHLFVTPDGNVAVDPLALEADELERLVALGGVAWIAVTNRDHVRDTAALRERFGARVAAGEADAAALGIPVDRMLADGDTLFPGATIVGLEHQKSPGEFAIHLKEHKAVLVGDALFGTPAGALSLPPDKAFADVRRAVLGLRRLWSLQPDVLLVGDGTPLFAGATRAIGNVLFERAGLAVNRINLDELRYEASAHGPFRGDSAEAGFWIGAERLGYQVATLPPGARFCPVHAEFSEEELFFVLEGTPSIRTEHETLPCRKGDFIAFPVGRRHAHQVINESSADATILLLGEASATAIVYYPESDKLLAVAPGVRYMVRNSPQLDYFDGE
jgi:uncharacterized cupin superfamily protein